MNQSDLPAFIEHLNASWVDQNYAALADCYHPEVVLLPPDVGTPITGREAVITTYRDFHALVNVREFEVTELSFFPHTAATMCHMRFAITYELNDRVMHESGMDIYTIVPGPENAPVISWRAQITL